MWRLLTVCLPASCAVNDSQRTAADNDEPNRGRIVQQVTLRLGPAAAGVDDAASRRAFRQRGTHGWVDDTGTWQIEAEVRHGRFLCATYEAGIQLGRGDPACSNVAWLTEPEFVTRLRHCNHATRLHTGRGRFSESADRLHEASCVRVVVRCEGNC